jgi:glycosyltransferase involved in cell wall biosynthesis
MANSVSVALIVRDEGRVLHRCLQSLRGGVDEIVVVDTGSIDDTKEIARRYTDRVFDFAWCQDFAAARQFAFDQARGDWVAWVDADDVVRDAAKIRPMVAAASAEVAGFYWRYVCDRDAWGNSRCEFWRERCVRNDGRFRWAGRIHEVLVPGSAATIVRSPDVVVEHHPDLSRAGAKSRRNLDILEAEHAEIGEAPSPRLLYYLAREYVSAGEIPRALETFDRYLRVSTWDEERYLAQTQVADIYRSQQRWDEAIAADLTALGILPGWPDAYFGLARTNYFRQDWPKVVHWSEAGRAQPEPDTLSFRNPLDTRQGWIIYYTNALYHLGRLEEALGWTRRALELCPDDAWHRENFLLFTERLQAGGRAAPTVRSAPRPPPHTEPLRVVWDAPLFVRNSFGVISGELSAELLRLAAEGRAPGLELSLRPEGPSDFEAAEDPGRLQPLAERIGAPLSGPAHVHVRQNSVPFPQPPPEGRWVVYQPWEFGGVPRSWLAAFHGADEVWATTEYVRRCYVESGIAADKIHVVPNGVNPEIFNPAAVPAALPTSRSFKFLFVGGTIWRKGIDVLLDAYGAAFGPGDDVCLVIKDVGAATYYRGLNIAERIRRLRSAAGTPEIVYVTTEFRDRDVAGLYAACDCLVHPYRGEGFGLPVAEAMACGRPVIVTEGGACDDFCPDDAAYRIPGRPTPTRIWEDTAAPTWVLEPDRDALVARLREVYEHPDEARRRGQLGSRHVLAHFTWRHAAERALARLMTLTA